VTAAPEVALLERVRRALLGTGGEAPFAAMLAADAPTAARAAGALAALASAGGEVDAAALARLAADDPAGHAALLLVVVAAHYADPAVRAAIGYPGPAAIALPPLPDARDADLLPLLERVQTRRLGAYRAMPAS
jgi:hypothetical protein